MTCGVIGLGLRELFHGISKISVFWRYTNSVERVMDTEYSHMEGLLLMAHFGIDDQYL